MTGAWRLRALGRNRVLRGAVRALMALRFRHGHVYTIRQGPLRGRRWFHHRDHQFWMPMGAYEPETSAWLAGVLEPGATFFDVGAHAGYFTLLGSAAVGAEGRVVAFEPVDVNLDVLLAQIELNRVRNVRVEPCAISDSVGRAAMAVTKTLANAHLDAIELTHAADVRTTTVEVPIETLDHFVERTGLRPDVLKIDVEGAEVEVLRGAARTLATGPALIVSTHSEERRTASAALLRGLGYDVAPLAGFAHELTALPAR